MHAAIGKHQQYPFEFALQHNLSNPAPFNFDIEDNNGKTCLHYAIKKANYHAFGFMLNHHVSDCFSRDADLKTPRQNAFINTGFYRVLVKEEKNQIIRLITEEALHKNGVGTRCEKDDLALFYKNY